MAQYDDYKRPSWDEYFMAIARQVETRSTCLRRHVGAVIERDRQILSTGYNGAPAGLPHCAEVGCLREQLHVPSGTKHELCRAIHAEQNAVVQAARHGVSVEGATIYTTTAPCVLCVKILLNAGIKEIVYDGSYPDELAQVILKESGITVRKFSPDEDAAGGSSAKPSEAAPAADPARADAAPADAAQAAPSGD